VATSKAAHHAISSLFDSAYNPEKEGGLVVQYEVKLQNGLEGGGAYMKLLTESPEVSVVIVHLHGRTPDVPTCLVACGERSSWTRLMIRDVATDLLCISQLQSYRASKRRNSQIRHPTPSCLVLIVVVGS